MLYSFPVEMIPIHGLALKLKSYGVAKRELTPNVIQDMCRYANNRAETIPPTYYGK